MSSASTEQHMSQAMRLILLDERSRKEKQIAVDLNLSEAEALLLPLIISLARLVARQDAEAAAAQGGPQC